MRKAIKFVFTERYLPPRCRKFRERDRQSSITVNIKECKEEDAPLAMIVKRHDCEDCEIRVFKGRLYRNAQGLNFSQVEGEPLKLNETINSMNWQFALWGNAYYNHCRWNGERGDASSIESIRNRASEYLIIGNMVFERTTEPVYHIVCFGNKPDAGVFVDYWHEDLKGCNCYSALEREECYNSLESILSPSSFKLDKSARDYIQVLMPEFVKFKRQLKKK